MGERWHSIAKGLIEQDLPRGVVDMVIATNDRGYSHTGIINDNDKIIDRSAIAPLDDQVVQLFVVEGYRSLDKVIEGSNPILRRLEADDKGSAAIFSGQISAGAVVFRLSPLCKRFLTLRLKLLGSTVASVRLPFGEKFLDLLLVKGKVLRLVVGPFVPVQTKPLHPLQNGVNRLLC